MYVILFERMFLRTIFNKNISIHVVKEYKRSKEELESVL